RRRHLYRLPENRRHRPLPREPSISHPTSESDGRDRPHHARDQHSTCAEYRDGSKYIGELRDFAGLGHMNDRVSAEMKRHDQTSDRWPVEHQLKKQKPPETMFEQIKGLVQNLAQ